MQQWRGYHDRVIHYMGFQTIEQLHQTKAEQPNEWRAPPPHKDRDQSKNFGEFIHTYK